MNRVLFLSYNGMTDSLGQAQVLPYLTGLAEMGMKFTLISFEKASNFDKERKTIEVICAAANIDWYPLSYTKNPPIYSTFRDIGRMKKLASNLQRQRKFDFVHCRSYLSSLAGLWMKRKYGLPFIFDMRGFWADERIDGGMWDLKNPIYRILYRYFKRKERDFLNNASQVVSLTNNAKKELLSWKSMRQPLPITVIPCCVDTDLFNPLEVRIDAILEKRRNLGIQDSAKICAYFGSIGTWYLLDEMLDFFKAASTEDPSLVFLFVTPDDQRSIRDKAREKAISEELIFIVSSRRSDMPLYISLCDFSIFFIKPAFSKKASSPTKQGEIMAMGKPVICNKGVGDTDFVIEHYRSGVLIEEFSEKAYIQGLSNLKELDKENLRAGAVEYFSLKSGLNAYYEVYKKVLSQKYAK